MMEANDNRIVLVVDDSMLICKQIISCLLYTSAGSCL